MKNPRKKLTLSKETVKNLSHAELQHAAAGIVPSHSYLCLCPN